MRRNKKIYKIIKNILPSLIIIIGSVSSLIYLWFNQVVLTGKILILSIFGFISILIISAVYLGYKLQSVKSYFQYRLPGERIRGSNEVVEVRKPPR